MQNTIRDLSELGRLDRTQSPKQAYMFEKFSHSRIYFLRLQIIYFHFWDSAKIFDQREDLSQSYPLKQMKVDI